jgi:hypothetical protein
MVGRLEGFDDGLTLGRLVGFLDGFFVGRIVGFLVGRAVGRHSGYGMDENRPELPTNISSFVALDEFQQRL